MFRSLSAGRLPAGAVGGQVAAGNNDVVPVADEMTRRGASQRVALPDEMRLIEIAGLVENVGPEPLRRGKMRDQRRIETDRSRIVLGRQAHFGPETTLELTGAEPCQRGKPFNPRAPSGLQQQARGVIDPVLRRTSFQHRAKPAFGGSDTR